MNIIFDLFLCLLIIVVLGFPVVSIYKNSANGTVLKIWIMVFVGAIVGSLIGLGLSLLLLMFNSDFKSGSKTVNQSVCIDGEIIEDRFGQQENVCRHYSDVETPMYQFIYEQSKLSVLVGSVVGCWFIPIILMSNTKKSIEDFEKKIT